jgi:hypothetical protein
VSAAAITPAERRRFLAPLALAQFICSFAGSNVNVMINDKSGAGRRREATCGTDRNEPEAPARLRLAEALAMDG